ncbi:MAG: TVP38/TMEM64 family protein [Smithella sp.]
MKRFSKFNPEHYWKLILFVILITCVIILFRLMEWEGKIALLRNWISSLGAWGPFVFVILYIIAVILALPGSAITIVGATLFGSVLGTALVSIASTIGAGLAFLIARHIARELILQWIGKNEKFQKLERLTVENGAIIVAIVRLVPLFPFNIVNYGFGLTAVPFRTYLFWSWLGMLPATILYVVGTDAVISGLMSGKIPWQLLLVLLPTAIILALLIRQLKKKIGK